MAAVFSSVHLSGSALLGFLSDGDLAAIALSLNNLADPAVSYIGTGLIPNPLR